jgi:hypothetical protein
MLERDYQAGFIKRLRQRFPECVILKNDTSYMQGVPDLLLLWHDRWAILEVKPREPRSSEDFEPNQEWYLEKFNEMSYAACVHPGNEEEVLNEIQSTFTARRQTRVLKC